jgi:RNA polymerase sigma-70 factor (ECF subfamily)
MVGQDRRRAIEHVLSQIPVAEADVIRLRIYGELPFEGVAAAVGCPLATAKSRFRYGIDKLRRLLDHDEVMP